MSRAYKCDNCGNLFEHAMALGTELKLDNGQKYTIILSVESDSSEPDLCDKCLLKKSKTAAAKILGGKWFFRYWCKVEIPTEKVVLAA